MQPQSFLYGAVILFSASLFNKFIGFFYQIAIIRLIQAEGIGLFNMVYPIYVMLLVVTSLGIPVAIAKLVAEEVSKKNLAGAYRIFRICLAFIVTSSTLMTTMVIFLVPFLVGHVFPNPDVYMCFVCLIPGIVIVSLCSAFRGFFQGLQQMAPTAITQALEQTARVCAGLFFANYFLPRGIAYAAMGVSLGSILGEFVGLAAMLYIYHRGRPKLPKLAKIYTPESISRVLRRVFSLGIPVTLTRFVSSGLMSVDAIIIPQRLQISGLSLGKATSFYGQLVGVAGPLFLTPAIITIALATALVPAISEAMAQKNTTLVQTRTVQALKLTLLAGLPCVVIFFVLPCQICALLFGYREAGHLLQILALSGPLLYLHQTTTGILHGLGRADCPFKNMLFGSIFKLSGLYYLTALPAYGIKGAALSFSISYVVMSFFNLRDLRRLTRFRVNVWKDVVKPIISSAIMGLLIYKSFNYLLAMSFSEGLCTSIALVVGVTSYILLLFVLGCIDETDKERFKNLLSRR